MTIKIDLVSLVQEKKQRTVGIPELEEFFGYLVDELNTLSESKLEEYNNNCVSALDILRLVAWQSVPINVEFSEGFIGKVIGELR